MPVRIQRRRIRGWKKPPNTVYVGRPTCFGNPFTAKAAEEAGYRNGPKMAVFAYREWLSGHDLEMWSHKEMREVLFAQLESIRGKNLACWCALHQSCHVDVLLEIANAAP